MEATSRTLRARRARARRRAVTLPAPAQVLLAVAALVAANAAYQVARKPAELLGLVVAPSPRAPEETWAEYGPLFREHATDVVPPELLAALVQVESAGDPLALGPWRWRLGPNPLELYGPPSSAVGLLQITDGTFAEARRLCIHDHAVARDGPWHDPSSCWFNALYARTVPSHAIEMTSALLHQTLADLLPGPRLARTAPAERERLAAAIHLCGRGRGAELVRRGLRLLPGETCGAHDLGAYLARVEALGRAFARMAAGG